MTRQEVIEILGPPTMTEGGGLMDESLIWERDKQLINVEFTNMDDVTHRKYFVQQTMWGTWNRIDMEENKEGK